MNLYILRHGLAAERDRRSFPDDRARPLTPKGEKKLRKIVEALAAGEIALHALVSSPLPRALQTAEIVQGAVPIKKSIVLAEELSPDGDPRALVARLVREFPNAAAIMLIGHEPFLSRLISMLLTGREDGVALTLKKGGLCCLSVKALRYGQCAVLESLVTPKLLIGKCRDEEKKSQA